MEDKFVSYAVEYNDQKEPISAIKVATLKESVAKEIVAKVKNHKKAVANQKQRESENELVRNSNIDKKLKNQGIIVAYLMFNELVEKGVLETTDRFETMFMGFLYGGEFNGNVAPSSFLKILERVI